MRGFWIKRTVEVEVKDKTGKTLIKKEQQWFPCQVNAAIPLNHRMLC